MSYYILPRIESGVVVKPSLFSSKDKLKPYISQSLITYMNESHLILEQQLGLDINKGISIKMLNQVIHTYDFLFSVVSGTTSSISQIQVENAIFFDIIEIYNTLKIYDELPDSPINILLFGKASSSVLEALNRQRINWKDYSLVFQKLQSSNNLLSYLTPKIENPLWDLNIPENMKSSCHILYFEANNEKEYLELNRYILYLIRCILSINNYQVLSGVTIIKIDNITYKPIVDLIYLISGMYEKSYIMKPNTSNVITNERYIICKHYNGIKKSICDSLICIYNELEKTRDDIIIESLLGNKIFSYFANKLEESNIIIGQQKLDAYAQIINLLKSKNKMGKIDMLQKHNIQKCMYWCDKYKIPFNKMGELTQTCVFISENPHPEESIENSTDELFYLYMEKHYSSQSENDDYFENENNSDLLEISKINNYLMRTAKV